MVRVGGEGHPLVKVHDAGLFSGVVPGPPADYRLAVRYGERVDIVDDPYRWLPTLGEIDLHLIGEGRHERLWDVLGAHVRTYDTPAGAVTGTSFAVWAPDGPGRAGHRRLRRLERLGAPDARRWAAPASGSCSCRASAPAPATSSGSSAPTAVWREKADPLAFAHRDPAGHGVGRATRPPTSGPTTSGWTARAHGTPHAEPMSVYEVHLGSWRPGLDYREMADAARRLPRRDRLHPRRAAAGGRAPVRRVVGLPGHLVLRADRAVRHARRLPVLRRPPAPGRLRRDRRLGARALPADEWALARFDGTPLYEHADPRRGEQPDWGTFVFDFGRREVRNFLVANALYWLEQFHIDGLRVDAVASMLYLDYSRPEGQWLPNIHGGRENLDAVAFLQEMNATVYRHHPGVVTIAEESTAWPGVSRPTHLGGLGFGFKWNMGWMHDTLDYIGRDPIYRGYHHNQMTFSLMYAFSENFVLPISPRRGRARQGLAVAADARRRLEQGRERCARCWRTCGRTPASSCCSWAASSGRQREWSEQRSLDWHLLEDPLHGGIKTPGRRPQPRLPGEPRAVDAGHHARGLLLDRRQRRRRQRAELPAPRRRRRRHPTCWPASRTSPAARSADYRVGLPFAGRWREVLNTDAEIYGGSGVGNLRRRRGRADVWHGRPASAVLQLPPAGVLWLAPERPVQDEIGAEQAADIGQAAAVAPFAPEVVGDTTSAITVPDSPAALTDMPEAPQRRRHAHRRHRPGHRGRPGRPPTGCPGR